jgi:hypothetical protein
LYRRIPLEFYVLSVDIDIYIQNETG